MRVVSLAASNTEIACALGCGELLVGVDVHSDHPASVVSRLPRLGKELDIDVEAVVALRPDLALASLTVPGHERVVAGLEAAGLPFIAPDPTSLADVYRDIRDVAAALEVAARGEALVDHMERRIEGGAVAPDQAQRPVILVEWWPRPVIAPGACSWVTDLVHLAGGVNPVGARQVKSTPLGDDEVVAMAPDAVVISWCGVPPRKYRPRVVRGRAGWAELPAVIADRIYTVPEGHLGRPGPRLVEGFVALRQIVADILEAR